MEIEIFAHFGCCLLIISKMTSLLSKDMKDQWETPNFTAMGTVSESWIGTGHQNQPQRNVR